MRYLAYLLLYLVLQLVTYLITPLLPLLAVRRECWNDNKSIWAPGWKLPKWLSWFDTPDNSLDGDTNHINKYITYPRYLQHLLWLYRNSLYGFKWSVMGARIDSGRIFDGNTKVNYVGPVYGTLRVSCDKYWQWKKVTPSKLFKGRCWVLNFGWLLDDPNQETALWMFSPRLKRIKNVIGT